MWHTRFVNLIEISEALRWSIALHSSITDPKQSKIRAQNSMGPVQNHVFNMPKNGHDRVRS